MTLKNSYLGGWREVWGDCVELGGTDCMLVIVPVTEAVGKKVRFCFAFGARAGVCVRAYVLVVRFSRWASPLSIGGCFGTWIPKLSHQTKECTNTPPARR